MKKIRCRVGEKKYALILITLLLLFIAREISLILNGDPAFMQFQLGPFRGDVLIHEVLLVTGGYLLLFVVGSVYENRRSRRGKAAGREREA